MVVDFARIHPAPGYNRVASADRCRFAEPRAEGIYIILLEKRICNDVDYIALVVIPILHREIHCRLLDSVIQLALAERF